ncbi:DUF4209 domain-containing protein [Xanthobacter versatilis]|uniref:DUF4209 domain-containing protein n=1 Tax=Xanthobacter autotrophicus (strain ATCC BAA-1158 / Py2) TaxID=78245 RepID=UPI0037274863
MSEALPEDGRAEAPAVTIPPWSEATVEDIVASDIDGQIPDGTAADWHSLSDVFHTASKQEGLDPGSARTFRMVGGLSSMMLQAESSAEPFRPILVWADGRRSSALQDFRPCVSVVAAIAERSQHPAIIARAADVTWMLQRHRHDMGRLAFDAYGRLLDEVAAGKLRFEHETEQEGGRLGIGVLRRCVTIARSRSFGDQAPDITPLAARIEVARQGALACGEVGRHLAFVNLELDYGLQDPAILAPDIEATVDTIDIAKDGHLVADALKVAIRTYHRAQETAKAHACQRRLSNVYVAMSQHMGHSAMLASGFLADAISALAGVRDARDRRRDLRHLLIDAQAGIADEMGSISHPLDMEDLRAEMAKQVEGLSFYDALFLFAMLRSAPDPAKAREEAIESMNAHPLSSLFGASFHDREGKKRHSASGGGSFGEAGDDGSIEAQVARHQLLSRTVDVELLDVARRYISRTYYIAPDVLKPVLVHSPFVPDGQENLFARGLSSFLCGDATSAIFVLTPLVEAGVRWLLKSAGHEVTSFDDATQDQEDKTLSALYRDQRADIEAVFGPELTFNIEQVFLHPAGPQLRHGVAHGLLHDGDPFGPDGFYACWLVLHLCLMPLYEHRASLGLWDLGAAIDEPA